MSLQKTVDKVFALAETQLLNYRVDVGYSLKELGYKMENTPKLYNMHKDQVPLGAVYIGRPSKWCNPFIIGKDGTREEVIHKYIEWIESNEELKKEIKTELKGKSLSCYCSPKLCHGHILLRIANS